MSPREQSTNLKKNKTCYCCYSKITYTSGRVTKSSVENPYSLGVKLERIGKIVITNKHRIVSSRVEHCSMKQSFVRYCKIKPFVFWVYRDERVDQDLVVSGDVSKTVSLELASKAYSDALELVLWHFEVPALH